MINIILCIFYHQNKTKQHPGKWQKIQPKFVLAKKSIGSCKLDIWWTSVWEPPIPIPGLPTPAHPPSTPHSLFIIVMSRASCAFSNRSDEDDLPPDLAEAVGVTTATTTNTTTAATQVSVPLPSPKVQNVSSPHKSEGKGQLSPGAKVVWGGKPWQAATLAGSSVSIYWVASGACISFLHNQI